VAVLAATAQATVLNQAEGRIAYRFHARDLHLVMGPAARGTPERFHVRIDEQPPGAAHGDQAIPPDAQRQFAPRMGATTVEVSTNHVAMVSHPDEVLQLIKTAAEAASR
jgi:hypothetical protein